MLGKLILGRGVGALELLPVRYSVALVSLIAVMLMAGRLRRLDRDTWKKGMLLGAINMAGTSIFLTLGLEHLSASVMSLMLGLVPLTTVAFAHLLIEGEKMHPGLLPGFVLALAGTAFLVEGTGNAGANPAVGFALAGVAVVAAGSGGALTRRFALTTPAAELIVPQFVGAAAIVLATSAVTGSLAGISEMDGVSWGLTAIFGLGATTVPFAAMLWLSESTTAARVALISYLTPLVGVAGGVLILDEPLGLRLVLGGVLILTGVVLADRSERRAHRRAIAATTL